MAAAASRPDRAYHQDYICRIRYENNLPPPPGSVKLLDIPIDGLDYYASPGFASRLHRSQPINIEADAELGMPINLVGMPGVFDGDESCKEPAFHLQDLVNHNVIRSNNYHSYSSSLDNAPSQPQGQKSSPPVVRIGEAEISGWRDQLLTPN